MIRLMYEDGPLLVRALEVLARASGREVQLQTVNLTRHIQDQLRHRGGGDLVDMMAEVLAQPDCRNVLGGGVLTHLREAILTPGEVDTVRAMMKVARSCAGCGTSTGRGELLTAGSTSVLCINCSQPLTVSCRGCHKTKVEIPGSIRKRLLSIMCPACVEAQKTNAAQKAAEPPHLGPPPPLQFYAHQEEWQQLTTVRQPPLPPLQFENLTEATERWEDILEQRLRADERARHQRRDPEDEGR